MSDRFVLIYIGLILLVGKVVKSYDITHSKDALCVN
jgi:hypothetical protein